MRARRLVGNRMRSRFSPCTSILGDSTFRSASSTLRSTSVNPGENRVPVEISNTRLTGGRAALNALVGVERTDPQNNRKTQHRRVLGQRTVDEITREGATAPTLYDQPHNEIN